MRYRNKKTGIEFTSSCVLSGEDYEEIKPKVAAPKAVTNKGNYGGKSGWIVEAHGLWPMCEPSKRQG